MLIKKRNHRFSDAQGDERLYRENQTFRTLPESKKWEEDIFFNVQLKSFEVIFKESKRMHGLRIIERGRNSINNIVPDSVAQPLQVIKGLVMFSPKGQVATSQRIPEYSHCKNLTKVNRGAASHTLIDGIPNQSFQVFVINGDLIPGIQEFDGDKI